MNDFYIGIDIGGTTIKFGVVSKDREILEKRKSATPGTVEEIIQNIYEYCLQNMDKYKIKGIGISTAGSVNAEKETVIADNLPFENTPVVRLLREKIKNVPIKIENDASSAALAESFINTGVNRLVMVTLGTGVGGGVIINKKILSGSSCIVGELGHVSINYNGIKCICGNNGCWEHYASVTALINQTKEAVKNNPQSILAGVVSKNNGVVDGETVFYAMDLKCPVAVKVFEEYVGYIAAGIRNLFNIFMPDKIVISGGITVQGDRLLKPIKDILNDDIKVEISRLQNDAGILGAAMLNF